MFIKIDGGETDSIQTARSFLSYDDAVAFCKSRNLATVELVIKDDESEYTMAVRSKHVKPPEEDIQQSGPAETKDEAGFCSSITPDSESTVPAEIGACDLEIKQEADECRLHAEGEEPEPGLGETEMLVVAVDESEVAIASYAKFEKAAEAPEFHFHPPEKCDVCGVGLSGRSFFVDGRVGESGEWRDMCSQCFFLGGARIGPGKGQLYHRQNDGRWLLVGGFGQ